MNFSHFFGVNLTEVFIVGKHWYVLQNMGPLMFKALECIIVLFVTYNMGKITFKGKFNRVYLMIALTCVSVWWPLHTCD